MGEAHQNTALPLLGIEADELTYKASQIYLLTFFFFFPVFPFFFFPLSSNLLWRLRLWEPDRIFQAVSCQPLHWRGLVSGRTGWRMDVPNNQTTFYIFCCCVRVYH